MYEHNNAFVAFIGQSINILLDNHIWSKIDYIIMHTYRKGKEKEEKRQRTGRERETNRERKTENRERKGKEQGEKRQRTGRETAKNREKNSREQGEN